MISGKSGNIKIVFTQLSDLCTIALKSIQKNIQLQITEYYFSMHPILAALHLFMNENVV